MRCALKRYVFEDPNTSLLKSRQFAEFIAARLLLDVNMRLHSLTFEERIRELRKTWRSNSIY